MKLKEMPREELELLSQNDLTYMILKENKTKMTTPEIFKVICDLLEYSEQYYFDAIADYYTELNLDKRFKLIDGKDWDLRENYPSEIEPDDEEDEEEVDEEEEEEEIEEEEDNYVDDEIIDDDEEDDELANLSIVDEDDMEED